MRPFERIQKIIAMLGIYMEAYPEKSFGQHMEALFTLMQQKYVQQVNQGNARRADFLLEWASGIKQTPSIVTEVLKDVQEKESEETRVHVMLVEDDILEFVLKQIALPLQEKPEKS